MRLIDADTLHTKILEENRRNYAATENVAQILLRIETAPTIDAEPVRHGRWLTNPDNGERYCNQCGWVASWANERYCSYCGAEMEGSANDAD